MGTAPPVQPLVQSGAPQAQAEPGVSLRSGLADTSYDKMVFGFELFLFALFVYYLRLRKDKMVRFITRYSLEPPTRSQCTTFATAARARRSVPADYTLKPTRVAANLFLLSGTSHWAIVSKPTRSGTPRSPLMRKWQSKILRWQTLVADTPASIATWTGPWTCDVWLQGSG